MDTDGIVAALLKTIATIADKPEEDLKKLEWKITPEENYPCFILENVPSGDSKRFGDIRWFSQFISYAVMAIALIISLVLVIR